MAKIKIGIIGGGNMATAIISGLVADGTNATTIFVADRNSDKLGALNAKFGVQTTLNVKDVAEASDVLILAVKPNALENLCRDIRDTVFKKNPLILSIATAISVSDLGNWLGNTLSIVRAMPNTPSTVQAGASALFANDQTSVSQKEMAETIMRAVGITIWLEEEHLIDAVVAVAGSAPAYYFKIMEIIQEAGVAMGLDPKTAKLIITQTLFGSGKMALELPESYSTLREQVTSKGGTTQAALDAFDRCGLKDVLYSGLEAARSRSVELSETYGHNRKLNS